MFRTQACLANHCFLLFKNETKQNQSQARSPLGRAAWSPEDTAACQHGHTEAAAGTAALWAALRTIPSSPPQLRGSIQPHRHRLPMGGLCGLSFFGCQLLNRAQSARVWCRSKLQVPTVPPRACKVGPSQPRKGLQVLGTKKKARCPPHPLCCPQHAPGPWPFHLPSVLKILDILL